MNENEEIMVKDHIMQKNFIFFGLLSGIYACFFTFCLYKNMSGITIPFFTIGTLCYYYLCMKKLEVSKKIDGYFYQVAIISLGFATWITDDERIILMNFMVVFILLVSFMMHQFFHDKEWDIPQYIAIFCTTLIESIFQIAQPFQDLNHMIKSRVKGKNSKIQYVFMGLLISIPFLIVILILLSSADSVFENSLEFIWKNIVIPQNFIGITLMTILAFLSSYCFLAFLSKDKIESGKVKRKEGEPIIAITFTTLIALIYIVFSGIQVFYLFLGNIPRDYSYAQYAREGFFQLVAVCILNLTLVLFCIYYFRDHKVLKMMLMAISLCTYIMIASSAFRMILYIRQYQLTFLRIFVLWSLMVIFMMMTGIIIFILKPKFPLFKYSIITMALFYVILAFSHPDYLIAKYNYGQISFSNEGRFDSNYLSELCGDAAPAILEYTKQLKNDTGESLAKSSTLNFRSYFLRVSNNGEDMDARTFNLSKYLGKNAADEFFHENQ